MNPARCDEDARALEAQHLALHALTQVGKKTYLATKADPNAEPQGESLEDTAWPEDTFEGVSRSKKPFRGEAPMVGKRAHNGAVYLDVPVIVSFPAHEKTEKAFQIPALTFRDPALYVKHDDLSVAKLGYLATFLAMKQDMHDLERELQSTHPIKPAEVSTCQTTITIEHGGLVIASLVTSLIDSFVNSLTHQSETDCFFPPLTAPKFRTGFPTHRPEAPWAKAIVQRYATSRSAKVIARAAASSDDTDVTDGTYDEAAAMDEPEESIKYAITPDSLGQANVEFLFPNLGFLSPDLALMPRLFDIMQGVHDHYHSLHRSGTSRPSRTELYVPSDSELLRAFYYLQHVDSFYDTINRKAGRRLKSYLSVECGWQLPLTRVVRLTNMKIFHSSYGFFPYKGRHILAEAELQERYRLINTIHAQRLRGKAGNGTRIQEEQKAAKEAEKESTKALRKDHTEQSLIIKKKPNRSPLPKVLQNEDISVRLRIREQAQYYSTVELVFQINYIDKKQLHQPSFESIVNLCEYNLRSEVLRDKERAYAYEPFERLWDEKFEFEKWSGEEYDENIKLLFRHLPVDDIKGHRMQTLGQPHTLIRLPYNGMHLSQCINTTDPFYDTFWQVRALRENIKTPGSICILTENPSTQSAVEKLVDAFINQSRPKLTPLAQFFHSPRAPQIDVKGMLEPSRGPRFVAAASKSWLKIDRYIVEQSVAGLYGHGSLAHEDYMYGICVAVPVPNGYHEGMCMHMTFEARIIFNEGYMHQRSLTKGDRFKVAFQEAAYYEPRDTWRGEVVDHGTIPGKTGVPVVLHRGSWNDPQTTLTVYDNRENELLTVTRSELDTLSHDRIHELLQNREGVHVTVIPSTFNNKEVKKLLSSQARLKAPPVYDTKPNAELHERLRDGCELHKGRELDAVPKKVLWATLTPSMQSAANTYAEEHALEDQKAIILNLKDPKKGMSGTLTGIHGCSGGGKTEGSCIIAAPYASEVVVSQECVDYQNSKRQQWTRSELERAHKNYLRLSANSSPTDSPVFYGPFQEVLPYTSKKQLPDGTHVVNGKILTVASRNTIATNAFVRMEKHIKAFRAGAGLQEHLGIRFHAEKAEADLTEAMLYADYDPVNDGADHSINETTHDLVLLRLKASHKRRTEGVTYKHVLDERIELDQQSIAARILQILGYIGTNESLLPDNFDLDDYPPEFLAVFGEDDLRKYKKTYSTSFYLASEAVDRLQEVDKRRLKSDIRSLAIILLQAASHVGVTTSTAQSEVITTYFTANAIWTDEMGLAHSWSSAWNWSKQPFADLRLWTGAANQTPPEMYGQQIANPFATTGRISPLLLKLFQGFHIHKLNRCARVQAPELVEVIRHANKDFEIDGLDDRFAAAEASVKLIRASNLKHWSRSSAVVFLDVKDAKCKTNSQGSKYCAETANVAVNAAIKLAQDVSKDHLEHILILSSYKSMKDLLIDHVERYENDLRQMGDAEQLKSFSRVIVRSTDQFQGHQADYVIYAHCAEGPPAFTWQESRVNVLLSRAEKGMTFVGSLRQIKKEGRASHNLVTFAQHCASQRKTVLIDHSALMKMIPFDDVLVASGIPKLHNGRARM